MRNFITSVGDGLKPKALGYGVGLIVAMCALMLRWALVPVLGEHNAFLTLWPAVVFSSWFCGVGPSILTVVVSLLGAWVWFIPPSGSFALNSPLPEISAMVGFVVFSGLIIGMGKANRDANRRRQIILAGGLAAIAKFRAVFQQTSIFAGILTLDGTLIEANRLSLEMCGYRAEDVLGKPFWETGWFHGSKELQGGVKAAVAEAAQGKPSRQVVEYLWADESKHVADFSIHPITDADGKVIFIHPSALDITALKQTEEQYRILAESLDAEVRNRTEELENQSKALRLLSRRLMEIQDQERRRLARELHDSAGQLLTALDMSVESILVQARSTSPKLAEIAEESSGLVQQISREIRTMSYLLHPPLLDEIGLPAALNWYVQGLVKRGGVEISLSIPDDFGRLPSDLELALFRLLQECLTNIYRHSGSKTAAIRFRLKDDKVELEVQDDGTGIPPERLRHMEAHPSGVGMQGMRERVRQFQGSMEVQSSASGTVLNFTFPVRS